MKSTLRSLFRLLISLLAAQLLLSAPDDDPEGKLQFEASSPAKTEWVVPERPAAAFQAAVIELRKLGYQIDHQESGALLRASQKSDPAGELRRAGFVNAKGPLLSDVAELKFKDNGDGSTGISLSVMRTAKQTAPGGVVQVMVSQAHKEEARIRASLAGASTSAIADQARGQSAKAPPSSDNGATAEKKRTLELKLKKSNVTMRAQPFAGELRMGRSGLEPVAHPVAPGAGQAYWLVEVDFINLTASDISLKGTQLEFRTDSGAWVASSKFLITAFVPYRLSSWTLPAKKRRTEKFLAEAPQGVRSLVLTCENAAPLTISSR